MNSLESNRSEAASSPEANGQQASDPQASDPDDMLDISVSDWQPIKKPSQPEGADESAATTPSNGTEAHDLTAQEESAQRALDLPFAKGDGDSASSAQSDGTADPQVVRMQATEEGHPLPPAVAASPSAPTEPWSTGGGDSGQVYAQSYAESIGAAPPINAPAIDADEAEEAGENWALIILRETVETIILAVVIFLLIRVGIQNYRIEGSSMEPNFHNGEYLLVNKLAFRLGEFHRGDVIVFKYPGDTTKDYIKRVIGLPGDTVEVRDRSLYVNGMLVDEPYQIMEMSSIPSGPTVVEPGTLYVMGDNRPASSDTRDWGLLNEDLVIGKAWLAIFPLDTFGVVDHPDLKLTTEMAQGP